MRTQLPSVLLLAALLSAVFLQASAILEEPTTSGWTRIKKPEDYQHAADIARFAVSRHNSETNEELRFVRMIRGYINGQYYRLVIDTVDGVKYQKYETLVYEKVLNKVRELQYFMST
ncbi:cysteine proteinase inhibitor 1-like [Wolffia australiana]